MVDSIINDSAHRHRSPSCRREEVAHVGTWCKAAPENRSHNSLPLLSAILVSWRLQYFFCQKCFFLIFQKDPIILPLASYHTHLHIAWRPIEIQTVDPILHHLTFISTIHLHEVFINLTPNLCSKVSLHKHHWKKKQLCINFDGKPKAHEARPPICSLSPLLWSLAYHPLRHQNRSPHLRRSP